MPFLPHVRPDHDETLVARLAADDLAAREILVAQAQVAECPACAELLADLRSIASATARLQGPQRTRDFRLTETDAARLRPTGWRGLLARLGSPDFAFAKPVASGLAALGIAGLILASIPSGLGGTAGAAPNTAQDSAAYAAGGAAPSAAASAAPAPAAAPGASGDGRGSVLSNPSLGVSTVEGTGTKGGSPAIEAAGSPSAGERALVDDSNAQRDLASPAQPPSPLLVLSIVFLVAALVLGGLRLIGRRLS